MLSSLCMGVFQMVLTTWISRLKDDMQFSLALALLPDKPITTHLKILQYSFDDVKSLIMQFP